MLANTPSNGMSFFLLDIWSHFCNIDVLHWNLCFCVCFFFFKRNSRKSLTIRDRSPCECIGNTFNIYISWKRTTKVFDVQIRRVMKNGLLSFGLLDYCTRRRYEYRKNYAEYFDANISARGAEWRLLIKILRRWTCRRSDPRDCIGLLAMT